jgi:hypothetical protein
VRDVANRKQRDGADEPRDEAILARWPGRCPYCAGPIRVGELIVHTGGAWLHGNCDKAAAARDEVGTGS